MKTTNGGNKESETVYYSPYPLPMSRILPKLSPEGVTSIMMTKFTLATIAYFVWYDEEVIEE